MPQITVNSANIIKFGFSVNFDPYNKQIVFDTSALSSYQGSSGSGVFNVQGICFKLKDQQGVEIVTPDWNNPQIIPSVDPVYTYDASSLPVIFLFQSYEIIGYIKDADGTIYETQPVYKNVCQPQDINESGYVPGIFQVIPDCVNNTLSVKELTVLTYSGKKPYSTTKNGTLYYPTGTIDPVTFTGTPFSNNEIFTGEYRINCTTACVYNLGDDIYVTVTYVTSNVFDVTCTSRVADLLCCIEGVQQTAIKHCNDAIGAEARQKMLEVSTYLMTALLSEINGQDSSAQVEYIRKALRCNCGGKGIHQNEVNPVNPSVYNIVLTGVGGTTVPSPTVSGATKTYQIASSLYQVSKKDSGDLAFTIQADTSIANTTRYLVSFDYNVMAGYILTAYENDPSYVSRLQALLVQSIDLSGLQGKCVLDTSTANYTLQVTGITSQDVIGNVVIGGNTYDAPTNTYANNATAVQNWLNSLSLGTFAVTFNAGVLSITTLSNSNSVATLTIWRGGLTGTKDVRAFQSSKYTVLQVLQAIIDYLCALTALQMSLGRALSLSWYDYNGDVVTANYTTGSSQDDYNVGLQNSVLSIVSQIQSLTGVTCAKVKALFVDRPNVAFGSSDRVFGTLGGDCAGLTDQQIAEVVIAAIGKYASVKELFCAIDCETPASCPDISDTSIAMAGSNIGIYGLVWSNVPQASQTVTVRYKLASDTAWSIATNALVILPNGNISGTTPFQIINPVAGQIYDVAIVNNCGGAGFSKQITIPTSAVYSGSYRLDNSAYLVCSASPVTLYSSLPFAAGVTMYIDVDLATPITGYGYIAASGSDIFTINPTTGVVGIDLGSSCSSGTAGSYILGNATGVICNNAVETLYTNGAFAVGGTLYRDAALTMPVTGYSYVVYGATNAIYNLNSVTGVVGVSTGLSCNFAVGVASVLGCVGSGSITNITFDGNQIGGGYPLTTAQSTNILTTANTTATLVVVATGTFGKIRVVDSLGNVYCQNSTGAGSYSFAGFIINPAGSTDFSIVMDCTSC